jgi:uncharacterized protein with WD repeat
MINEIDMITNTKYNKFLKARSVKVVQKKEDEEESMKKKNRKQNPRVNETIK